MKKKLVINLYECEMLRNCSQRSELLSLYFKILILEFIDLYIIAYTVYTVAS